MYHEDLAPKKLHGPLVISRVFYHEWWLNMRVSTHRVKWAFKHVVLKDHMTNWNNYIYYHGACGYHSLQGGHLPWGSFSQKVVWPSLFTSGVFSNLFVANLKVAGNVRTPLIIWKNNTKHCNLKATYYQPGKNSFKFHKIMTKNKANNTKIKNIKCCFFA